MAAFPRELFLEPLCSCHGKQMVRISIQYFEISELLT